MVEVSRKSSKGPTDNQIRVLISLLGLDKNGFKRTQKMVADHLMMPSSTVCETVKGLMEARYVTLVDGSKRDKFYSTGPRFPYVESAIQARLKKETGDLRSIQRTRGATSQPEHSESNEGVKTVNTPEQGYSVHLAGSWLQFVVDRQGSINSTSYIHTDPRTGKSVTLQQTIFGKDTEYELDGSRNWLDAFVLEYGKTYHIRYQLTSTGKRFFYVNPDFEVPVSPQAADDPKACVFAIVAACTPVLIWLERYAGWVFAKDEMGMYAPSNEIDPQNIHRALRGPLNDLAHELTGGAFVDNGDGLWADRSPGYSELETNRADYIQAMRDLPQTRQRVNTMWAEWPATKENLADLMEKVDMLARIVHRMYEMDRDMAQIGINAQHHRILSANQTTFDQYPLDKGDGPRSDGKPPEGYQ